MKTAEREAAQALRARGWSIKEIERRLCVSRSSVSIWVRDVELDDRARARLVERTRLGPLVAAERKAAVAREARAHHQETGRRYAHELGPDYVAGCMLYWAEGSKRRNDVQFTNSDPALVAYFVRFLRTHFGVDDEAIGVRCNLFADHIPAQTRIERYWLECLSLPDRCLRRSIVNTYSKYSEKKRTNKLPFGTCRISVHRTWIVQTIYGSIQELGGFDRPEWLG